MDHHNQCATHELRIRAGQSKYRDLVPFPDTKSPLRYWIIHDLLSDFERCTPEYLTLITGRRWDSFCEALASEA
jgi:hypothetical protein